MNRILPLFLSFIFTSTAAFAYRFEWNLAKGERIEMVKTAGISCYTNARLGRVYDERNVIDLTCSDRSEKFNRVHGVFSVNERGEGESVFRLKDRFMVDFLIENSGKFVVKKDDHMPNLRSIPSFPDRDIQVDDTWTANGELIIDNFSKPFKLIFPVEYRLVKVVGDKGAETAVISYDYTINSVMTGRQFPPDFPVKIFGRNTGIVYWDMKNNRPGDMKDSYKIVFVFSDSKGSLATAEFHMNIKTGTSFYNAYNPDQKKKEKDDLGKELPKGIDADIDKRGLIVRMGDLLFDLNSSELRPDTAEKLKKIAEIINRKYPGREIIVEGHSDNTGDADYNQSLSEKRARRVSEYLKSKSGHDKFSYRGYGQEKPLADNSTEEGRGKNRRVEIIIKLD